MNFDLSVFVWLIAGAYAIYSGVKKYKERNVIKNYKYTMESVTKFYTWYGILVSAIGVLMFWGAAIKLFRLPYILTMINVVVMFIVGVIVFVIYKKVLKEK